MLIEESSSLKRICRTRSPAISSQRCQYDGEVDQVAVRIEGFGQTLHLVAVGVGKSDVEPDPSRSRDLRTLLK
jgi:hypothetical protein